MAVTKRTKHTKRKTRRYKLKGGGPETEERKRRLLPQPPSGRTVQFNVADEGVGRIPANDISRGNAIKESSGSKPLSRSGASKGFRGMAAGPSILRTNSGTLSKKSVTINENKNQVRVISPREK